MKTYDLEELLIKLTEDTIKDVVEQYRDWLSMAEEDVAKLIELGIAKQLAKFVPDKWTKIDIETYEMGFDLNTLVQFTDDNGDTVTAVHNEESVLMLYPEDTSCIADSATLSNGYLSATFQVHQQDLIDQISAPMQLGISSLGCAEKPEDVSFGDISWIRDVPAASTIDNCGTSGWTEEKTLTIEDIEEIVEEINKISPPAPRSWTMEAAAALKPYDFRSAYNPHNITENAWLPQHGLFGWGAYEVDTLHGGQDLGECTDEEYFQNKTVEDYVFPQNGEGRGSKVETLPGGQGLGECTDEEYFQNKTVSTVNRPYELEYRCEFTPEDLEEMSDLLNKVQSEEMKF